MKTNFLIITIFFALCAVALQGCYYDNAEELYPTPVVVPVDTTVGFAADIKPFIETKCATTSGCHAAGSNNVELVSYDDVKQQVSRIEARAIVEKTMPPSWSAQPSQKQLDDLQLWIDNGALND